MLERMLGFVAWRRFFNPDRPLGEAGLRQTLRGRLLATPLALGPSLSQRWAQFVAGLGSWWRRGLRLGEPPLPPPTYHRTGLPPLDVALGGGLSPGRITVVQGAMAAGKTSLCLTLTARAQRCGHVAAWLDLDHTLHLARSRAHGVAPSTLVAQCSDVLRALDMATALLRGRHVTWLVLDPWPPLPTAQAPREALKALALAAAAAESVVLISQTCMSDTPETNNALRSVATTGLVIAQEAPPLYALRPACGPSRGRITVTKHAAHRRPGGAQFPTFIVPFLWDRGCLPGSHANSWPYI